MSKTIATKAKLLVVKSVQQFIDEIGGLKMLPGKTRFYRGHGDYKYRLLPGVYRHRSLINNEYELINEAVIRCPGEFPRSCTFFEVLVRLQHYGLPTRLLDLTSNAFAALFFACSEKARTMGEVIVLDVPDNEIKYYNSDTIAVVANLARRKRDFDLASLSNDFKDFNNEEEIGRLVHDVREDKPGFRELVVKEHLRRVFCVKAKLDNARIARQDGAFLLFGIDGKKQQCAEIPGSWIVRGPGVKRLVFSDKDRIKVQLEQFGISERTLFPELDRQTKCIVERFKER